MRVALESRLAFEGFAAGVAFARALHLLQAEAAAGSLAEVVAVPDTRWRHRRRST